MTTAAATTLYRRLLREAKQVHDYNFRLYAIRRIKAGYDRNRSIGRYVLRTVRPRSDKDISIISCGVFDQVFLNVGCCAGDHKVLPATI